MFKRLTALLLITACSQAPAPAPAPTLVPTPAPTPQPTAAPIPAPATRYTLVGVIASKNTCTTPLPSEIHMTITLANAEHSITSQPHRLGLLGRSYTIGLVWNDAWGKPTEWRDMKVTRFDNQPFCGAPCSEGHSCTGGASVVNAPVDGTTVRHDITLSCACSD